MMFIYLFIISILTRVSYTAPIRCDSTSTNSFCISKNTSVVELGGCGGILHGCCSNTTVPCEDLECSNCRLLNNSNVKIVGGCGGILNGCCSNTTVPCEDLECSNCRLLNYSIHFTSNETSNYSTW